MSSTLSGCRLFPLLDAKYRIPKKSQGFGEKRNSEKKLPRTPQFSGGKFSTSIKVKDAILYVWWKVVCINKSSLSWFKIMHALNKYYSSSLKMMLQYFFKLLIVATKCFFFISRDQQFKKQNQYSHSYVCKSFIQCWMSCKNMQCTFVAT